MQRAEHLKSSGIVIKDQHEVLVNEYHFRYAAFFFFNRLPLSSVSSKRVLRDYMQLEDFETLPRPLFQLDPKAFVDTCLYLYCSLPPRDRDVAVCDTLASYARECAQQHIIIAWRTAGLCGAATIKRCWC